MLLFSLVWTLRWHWKTSGGSCSEGKRIKNSKTGEEVSWLRFTRITFQSIVQGLSIKTENQANQPTSIVDSTHPVFSPKAITKCFTDTPILLPEWTKLHLYSGHSETSEGEEFSGSKVGMRSLQTSDCPVGRGVAAQSGGACSEPWAVAP